LLREPCIDPSAQDQCAIRWASSRGRLAVVECLLHDDRVDPSANNQDSIRWASAHGHIAVVECLLRDRRVDPSADDQFAVRAATTEGHYAVVERLLRDDRVGRDVKALRQCITNKRRHGQYFAVVALLERHLKERATHMDSE